MFWISPICKSHQGLKTLELHIIIENAIFEITETTPKEKARIILNAFPQNGMHENLKESQIQKENAFTEKYVGCSKPF